MLKLSKRIARLENKIFRYFLDRHLTEVAKQPLSDRFSELAGMAGAMVPEYRLKWPQMSWWNVRWFSSYLSRFQEDTSFNSDRRWMVYQLMKLVSGVPGDSAECGVYKGATSWLICKSNQESGHARTHYLFDSFDGLSQPCPVDGTHWQAGDLSTTIGETKHNLREYEQLVFLDGWIPTRFKEVERLNFAFVHIDVDLYEPTLQSIRFFYPRLTPGALLLCDDYGFDTCPGATKAMDDYFEDKPEAIVSLCSGGGFIIKANSAI